jgi:hypothetical protein
MLVSRQQLDFVRNLLDELDSQRRMTSINVVRAQQFAIIVGLRSVGHVLNKVDANTPKRKEWLKHTWPIWKQELIFCSFIEPARNQLVKEFQGWIDLATSGVAGVAICANPGLSGGVESQIDFSCDDWLDDKGQPMLTRLRQAILFWEVRLTEAERKFAQL